MAPKTAPKTIYLLKEPSQKKFAEAPEIFAGVQFGHKSDRYFLVLGCQVAIEFDEDAPDDLNRFYAATWGSETSSIDIVKRYEEWMDTLKDEAVEPHATTRSDLTSFVARAFPPSPPPPPNRPNLRPTPPPPIAPPPIVPNPYGHLPFQTTTRFDEHFYRFEPWPTSRKITVGDPGSIAAKTYASPSAELLFLNTGFAAVARNALPSLAPAVFRYELQPGAGHTIHCGAIVPNFGQSGGGVEVFFPSHVNIPGPIAKPVIIPPL